MSYANKDELAKVSTVNMLLNSLVSQIVYQLPVLLTFI